MWYRAEVQRRLAFGELQSAEARALADAFFLVTILYVQMIQVLRIEMQSMKLLEHLVDVAHLALPPSLASDVLTPPLLIHHLLRRLASLLLHGGLVGLLNRLQFALLAVLYPIHGQQLSVQTTHIPSLSSPPPSCDIRVSSPPT